MIFDFSLKFRGCGRQFEEVIIFRYKHTDTYFIIIYIIITIIIVTLKKIANIRFPTRSPILSHIDMDVKVLLNNPSFQNKDSLLISIVRNHKAWFILLFQRTYRWVEECRINLGKSNFQIVIFIFWFIFMTWGLVSCPTREQGCVAMCYLRAPLLEVIGEKDQDAEEHREGDRQHH